MPCFKDVIKNTLVSIFFVSITCIFASAQNECLAATIGETREIKYLGGDSSALAIKASQLSTPVAIYEYLYNTIEYTPYHGSRSGSINTFLGMRGNDVDIASTLIAMLRSINVPARYAVGDITITTEQAINWLDVGSVDVAVQLLSDHGIKAAVGSDNEFIIREHVWVEAYIPFDQYRGEDIGLPNIDCTLANNSSRCMWVPMDASFKLKVYNNIQIDPYNNINFDYIAYFNAIKSNDNSRRDRNPLTILEDQINVWLRNNHRGIAISDVENKGKIIPLSNGFLPASLPYKTSVSLGFDSVAHHDASVDPIGVVKRKWDKTVTVSMEICNPSEQARITMGSATMSLVEVATRKLTSVLSISADGTTIEQVFRLGDERIGDGYINVSNGGQLSFICQDGLKRAQIGMPYWISVAMDGAPAESDTEADQKILASYSARIGGYYLVATGGEYSNWSQVHRAAEQLLAASDQYKIVYNRSEAGCLPDGTNCTPYVDSNRNGTGDSNETLLANKPALDALTGGLLYVAATQYYTKLREHLERSDRLMKCKTPIIGFLGVVSSDDKVQTVDGTAFSVTPGDLLIDMKGLTVGGTYRAYEQNLTISNRQFEFNGHIASSLEHEVWQELIGYDAISTVRGIQMALGNGANLITAKRNSTTNNVPAFLSLMGFVSNPPPQFSARQRDIYSSRPTSWAHATITGAEGFELIKANPSSSSDARISNLLYKNTMWDSALECFDNVENYLSSRMDSSLFTDGYNCCTTPVRGRVTVWEVKRICRGDFDSFRGGANTDYFNYLDSLQGFNSSEFLYRDMNFVATHNNAYDIGFITRLRNMLLLQDINSYWLEYQLPSTLVVGPYYRFRVDIERVYNTSTGQLVSMSFEIANLNQ